MLHLYDTTQSVNYDATALDRVTALFKKLRRERRISLRQIADEAGVNVSVVSRAARGKDAKMSTWSKLFDAMGYCLLFDVVESSEEASALIEDEAERREDRRTEGLCSGKRRW